MKGLSLLISSWLLLVALFIASISFAQITPDPILMAEVED